VTGRALAFADKDIARMATEQFVPVTGDDWYQRRRDDAEGTFFRKVADQGPRKGEGGSTRQGVYLFTASGKLLAYKNHQDPEVMRDVLRQGLAAWKKLPAEERNPGAVKVEDLDKTDAQYTRTPPKDGLIVKVYTRILEKDGKGGYRKGSCDFPGGDAAARDHLWLSKAEWQSLIPADAKKGAEQPVPVRIAERIFRYHLVDNTRGEPTFWTGEEIREKKLNLTVEEATAKVVQLKLSGQVILATAADAAKANRGYDVQIQGTIRYDVEKKAIDRFDLVALGDHWGHGTYLPEGRPGRTPLGIVFELSAGDKPADRVPPQGARNLNGYLGRGE
jgi:hypothetical protein